MRQVGPDWARCATQDGRSEAGGGAARFAGETDIARWWGEMGEERPALRGNRGEKGRLRCLAETR